MLRKGLYQSLLNDVILIFSVLSKTSNLDDEDAKLSNNLPKSTSAAKKPTSKGKGDTVIQLWGFSYSFPIVSVCQNFQTRESFPIKKLSYVTSLCGGLCPSVQ